MRIVYMGTPEFAVAPLQALIDSGEEVVGVFTQPDKPVGRKAVITPPPVKVKSIEYNIPVFQPTSFKTEEAAQMVRELNPELTVVAAYGKILPQNVLDIPTYGSVCIHASLLPALRGAAPIQQSIINGCRESGITIMQMDAGIDTGDILLQRSLEIGADETSGELHDRLSVLGSELILEALSLLKRGELNPIKQDSSLSSYAPMLSKNDSVIDWTDIAAVVYNKIRGLYPWPVAVYNSGDIKLKIHRARLYGKVDGESNPGTLLNINGSLVVVCGDKNGVELLEVQAENSKRMLAGDYIRGHKI